MKISEVFLEKQKITETILEGQNFLLINPPVYDFRLAWSRWHQPTGLLQIANLLRRNEKDVRLIDCLLTRHGQRISRHKVGTEELGGYKFHKWHFGLSFANIKTIIKAWQAEGWNPDTVLISCMNSVWWQSTRDTIALLKKLLPQVRIILGGVYATMETEHAAYHSGADLVVVGHLPLAVDLPPDLSAYTNPPYSTGIYFYANSGQQLSANQNDRSKKVSPRLTTDLLTEIMEKTKLGVSEFLFFDEVIHPEDRDAFGAFLDQVANCKPNAARFVMPGNLPPSLITQHLAKQMRRARFTHLYLHCGLHFGTDEIHYTYDMFEYEECVNILLENNICRPREENLAAMLVVGLPYEDLNAVSERLIRLAHIAGSVILVPFQYVPGLHQGSLFNRALAQNGSFSPEKFNSKIYPLARLSGQTIEEYLELTRLAALLNSKYRSKTFDFLGDSLTAKLFQQSIKTESWNPFSKNTGETQQTANEVMPLKSSTISKRV
jgi:hypothetical protein